MTEIVIKKVEEVILWDKNPRTINDKDFDRLKRQIEKLGVYKPLLINQDNIVLGGNMRLRALRDMGIDEVSCSVVHTENEAEMVEYALSDNDRAGDYNQEQLAELVTLNPIDLELYHVDIGKTHTIKDVLSQFTDDEEIPEVETDPNSIKSKKGEVYILGEHRLMCGSSTEMADVSILTKDKKARMVFTDPPYMIDYKSTGGAGYNKGKYKHHEEDIFDDDLSDEDALDFYTKVTKNLYKFTTDDACLYWWFSEKRGNVNRGAVIAGGWYISQNIIWVKNNIAPVPGQLFNHAHEPCIVGWKKNKKHYQNSLVTKGKDIWSLETKDFAELADIWYEKRDPTATYRHPTQKPVSLPIRAIKRSSQIGDMVLDVFGGSGSTLIACEKNNRICYTMELDPAYCDVIRKRYAILKEREDDWEEYTKQE